MTKRSHPNLRGPAIYPTFCNEYIAAKAHRLKAPGTRRHLASTLKLLQGRHPGARVSELALDELVRFCTFKEDGQPRAPKGQLVARSDLITSFRWGAHVGYCSPALAFGLEQEVQPERFVVRPGNWLEPEAIQAVLDVCDDDDLAERRLRDRSLLLVGFFTGLRLSELAQVRWGHVDLVGGELSGIRGKRGRPVFVGLAPRIVGLLQAWKVEVAEGLGRQVCGIDPLWPKARSLLVGGPPRIGAERAPELRWGLPLEQTGLYNLVKRRGRLAGRPALAPHDLRRTFAQLLQDQGYSMTEIARAMRHEDERTTRIYLESNPRKAIEVGQSIDLSGFDF